ncbi:MAG: hypothetical protein ACRDGM_13560 [bacterium]
MMWVEIDMYDERALHEVKASTSVPICSRSSSLGKKIVRKGDEPSAHRM